MMGLPNVSVEDQQTVFQAISWYRSGLDFADALHLASSMKADGFVTFDKVFIKKARKLISIDITLP
jgi:predicted nucleic-acid-binding protein